MTNTMIQKASNREVVKRYGRSAIMKHAWFKFKQIGARSFSLALKGAWASMRDELALTLKCDALYAEIKADNVVKVQLAERKARYTGDHNSNSPLNPYRSSQGGAWGKGSDRYLNSVMGA